MNEVVTVSGVLDGVTVNPATVILRDDDGVGVTISKASLRVPEKAGTGTYTVVLDSQPSAAVDIAITNTSPETVMLDTDTLTFTNSNWNQPQTVTVTGVNDAVVNLNGFRTAMLAHVVSSDSDSRL